MGEIELPFPLGGLNDNLSFTDQAPKTTVEMVNMRGIDPATGRERGAQRSGISKLNTTAIGLSKVRDLASTTFDSRAVTYSESFIPAASWHHPASSQADVFAVEADEQGNVYALNRKGVDKRNSAGELIFSISVPLPHAEHSLGAMELDEFGGIIVGVTSGGEQSTATLWFYSQLPDDEFEILWEMELGMYVAQIRSVGDLLYVALNDDTSQQSFMQVYSGFDAASGPTLEREFKTAWPTADFDVTEEGILFSTHPRQLFRGLNPRFPDNTDPRIDWVPADLQSASERNWSWYASDAVIDDLPGLTQGDATTFLRDLTGNARHILPAGASTAPSYNEEGLAGKPTLHFDGVDDEMVTGPSFTPDPAYADQQPTAIPGYTGSMYAVFIVVRIVNEATMRWILAQEHEAGVSEPVSFVPVKMLIANRDDGFSLPGAPATPGDVCYYEVTEVSDMASGVNGQPNSASFDNATTTALISFICDGRHDLGTSFAAGATRSHFRVNGTIVETEYTSLLNEIADTFRTHLGAYTVPANTVFPFKGEFCEMLVLRDSLNTPKTSGTGKHVVEYDATTYSASPNLNEYDVIEGYLAHKWGIANLLNASHPFFGQILSGGNTQGPPSSADYQQDISEFGPMGHANQLLIAWDSASGKPLDVINDAVTGKGLGVRARGNEVYVVGLVGATTDAELRRRTFSDGTFAGASQSLSLGTAFTSHTRPRLDVDWENDLVYVPTGRTSGTSVIVAHFDGVNLLSQEKTITLPNSRAAHAVAFKPNIPDYDGSVDPVFAESIYIGGSADSGDLALSRYDLVVASPQTGSPRTVVFLAECAGDIKKYDFGSTVTIPTGGAGALDPGAQYVQSVTHYGEVFWTDGVSPYKVYTPRDDAVTTLASTSAGEVPPRAQLIESWRGRLFLGRLPDGDWAMSKVDDARNWDIFPPVETALQATSGTASRAGKVPDIVNTFIPYNDDLAIFGCDHHIYRLTGDPQAGGQIDLLSDVTGIAFGRPWCKDPEGNLYFFGSRGGVFVMSPGGGMERITRDTIERRTQNVDLSQFYVRLEWNYQDEGLHVAVMPFGVGGVILTHWFWDRKANAWYEDEYGDTTVQPTAMLLLDGDGPDDRILAIGCEDGFVRRWDKDALDDDGFRIDSRVLIGPVTQKDRLRDLRFDRLTVMLASDQAGCRYEVFSSNDPARKGDVQVAGHLTQGQNQTVKARVRGTYLWVRLRNADLSRRWAMESASIFVHEGGRKRIHS